MILATATTEVPASSTSSFHHQQQQQQQYQRSVNWAPAAEPVGFVRAKITGRWSNNRKQLSTAVFLSHLGHGRCF
jgi:hypothetical protein